MNELVVSGTAEITGRGLALFFDRDPDPVPTHYRLKVEVTRPDTTTMITVAFREFALKPPREVVAFVLLGVRKEDVPVGSIR